MNWQKESDTAIRAGNFVIAKVTVQGQERYTLYMGREFIGVFDTPAAARQAAADRDREELAGAA